MDRGSTVCSGGGRWGMLGGHWGARWAWSGGCQGAGCTGSACHSGLRGGTKVQGNLGVGVQGTGGFRGVLGVHAGVGL